MIMDADAYSLFLARTAMLRAVLELTAEWLGLSFDKMYGENIAILKAIADETTLGQVADVETAWCDRAKEYLDRVETIAAVNEDVKAADLGPDDPIETQAWWNQ